jgi:peptidoglycan/xylan/chitin deacetylase (PgdA/CDA1 family)
VPTEVPNPATRGLTRMALVAALFLTSIVTAVGATADDAAARQLIGNPSAERIDPLVRTRPAGWAPVRRGDNSGTFRYMQGGARTGQRYLLSTITSRRSGNARWAHAWITAQPRTQYSYTGWYRADVPTELLVEVRRRSGAVTVQRAATPPGSLRWRRATASFVTPTDAVALRVHHVIARRGFLALDDVSLTVVPPTTAPPTTVPPTTVPPTTVPPTTVPPTTVPPTTVPPTTVPPIPGGGLVANGSFETQRSGEPTRPASWSALRWGTHATTFTLATGGARSGERFASITTSSRVDGDAKWSFDPVMSPAGSRLSYSSWYRSTAPTFLQAVFTDATGALSYRWIRSVPAADGPWVRVTATVAVPEGAVRTTVQHVLADVGRLDLDDVSMTVLPDTPPPTGTKPVVQFTFDDGPHVTRTIPVLDMLDRYGVRATFFLKGAAAAARPSIVAEIAARGHAVGNHSYTHPDLRTLTDAGILDELGRTSAAVEAATGRPTTCMRAPYGYTDLTNGPPVSPYNLNVEQVIRDAGYTIHRWTHDTLDWLDTATVASITAVLDSLPSSPGSSSVVVLHDWQPLTLLAVDAWLAENVDRFDFRTIPSC